MKRTLIVVSVLCLAAGVACSQSLYGPDTSTYRMDIYKNGSNPVASDGLLGINTLIHIGDDLGYIQRAVYQWNMDATQIPSGSVIDSAQVFFQYDILAGAYFLPVYYTNIGVDLHSSPNLDTIWNHFSRGIGSGQGYQYGQNGGENSVDSVRTTFPSGSSFVTALQTALSNKKFTLGINYQRDLGNDINYLWEVSDWTVALKIWYNPPGSMTISQKLANGNTYGFCWSISERKFRFKYGSILQCVSSEYCPIPAG